MAAFFLHLLGDPVLRGPGGPVTGRAAYRRRVALLSILAVARGRPVGRERIIGLLWSEFPADAARHTLSETLYVLRKSLSDELFVVVGDEVALNPAVMGSDVATFLEAVEAWRLEDAVQAYTGPLLDGFYVADAPEFERWVDGERDRLARAYAQTLESLAVACETEGSWPRAAEWWRRLAAHDRYSSRVALRLVRALDAAGDRMAALRFAGTHAVLLREELGGEPGREFSELVEGLRAGPVRFVATAAPAAEQEPASAAEPEAVSAAPATEQEPASAVSAAEPEPAASAASQAGPPPAQADGAEAGAQPPPEEGRSGAAAEEGAGGGADEDGQGAASAQPEAVTAVATATATATAMAIATATATATASDSPPAPGRMAEARQSPDPRPPPTGPPRPHRRWLRTWALAAAGAVAAGLALAVLPDNGAAPAAPRYDPRRIAVLYLDDYSAGGELQYLANGLTEMLIHELSQVEALDVISRNGVKPYRDRPVPFGSMAADLRAGSVVEGSVQRAGDSVRITVQLIDANSQTHLESRSLVHSLDPGSLFALQDAVAGEVAAFLRRRVGREIRLSDLRRQAGDPRALELVLRASQAREDARAMARTTHQRDVRSALRVLLGADSMLSRAQRLDSGWTEPVLLRGWVAVDLSALILGAPRIAALQDAQGRAQAVLRQAPASVDARELRGNVLWRMVVNVPEAPRARDWLRQAEQDLRAVLGADPDRASAWATLGQLLRVGGDLAEAELAARRAQQEDAFLELPDEGADRLYRAALVLGDYPRARHWCTEGRRRFPADYRFRECALVLLARDPAAPPRPDSAWRLLAEADRVDPPAVAAAASRPYSPLFRRMMAAAVLARAGLGDSARAVSARTRRQAGSDAELRPSFLWDEAYLALLLGERARASALLDSFVAARPALREYVAREPAFAGVWRR